MMEKTLRVLGGEDAHSHGHDHAHGHAHGSSSAVAEKETSADGLRARKTNGSAGDEHTHEEKEAEKEGKGPSKLSAYLNLFGDFVHNMYVIPASASLLVLTSARTHSTDGLAMAASFYSSPLIGATTTLACFAHEIPHEIADYSILIRSGFSKRQAMQSQFLTAVGAFVGCVRRVLSAGISVRRLNGAPAGRSWASRCTTCPRRARTARTARRRTSRRRSGRPRADCWARRCSSRTSCVPLLGSLARRER
jgi:zinc transporter 7